MLRRYSICIVVGLFGALGLAGVRSAWAEVSASGSDTEQVLVLHNGGVLRGQIKLDGARYIVRRKQSQVDVAASQVAMVCESLGAAYDEQRRRLPRETAEAHLELADWCLRHHLAAAANRELADARRLDPRHPRLSMLERRVAVLSTLRNDLPQPVVPASAAAPVPPSEEHQFESLADELPEGALERFTRKIQPLLVNNCTTSGCHQPGVPQQFQLDRAVLRGLSNRRTTHRNLAATLALVDRAAPERSPLLTVPAAAHGGARTPIFGARQEDHLQALAEWIALVSGTQAADNGLGVAAEEATLSQIRSASAAEPRTTVPTPAARILAAQEEMESLRPALPLQYGAALTPWRPKDAFDPEIFNRRMSRAAEGR